MLTRSVISTNFSGGHPAVTGKSGDAAEAKVKPPVVPKILGLYTRGQPVYVGPKGVLRHVDEAVDGRVRMIEDRKHNGTVGKKIDYHPSYISTIPPKKK